MKPFIVLMIMSMTLSRAYSTNLIVKYIYEKDSLSPTKHSISDHALGIIRNKWDNVDVSNKLGIPQVKKIIVNNEKLEIVVINYTINTDGAYFMQDLFGHEILLDRSMNNDTITLKLKLTSLHKKNSRGSDTYYLNDSVKNTKLYVITYPQKFKYMGFFDSLAYLHGDLMYGGGGYSFKELNHDLHKYLAEINRIYVDRMRFYNSYVSSYYMPAGLKYTALKEIQYCYYNDLLEPLLKWDAQLIINYPPELRDTLNKIGDNLNAEKPFENTASGRTVMANYVYLGIHEANRRSLREVPDSLYIINRLKLCKTMLKGQLQNYALAYLMQVASQKNTTNVFDVLYRNYDHKTSSPGVNEFVDSLNNVVTHSGDLKPEEVLNLSFEDVRHQPHKLSEIFNKDVILIDCWATWCIPCREQMPALDSLANEYKGRVQFISISADQNLSKWDNWIAKPTGINNNALQLHASNGFENIFFKRLMIKAIPRYILLSRSGKIFQLEMPLPSEKEKFKKELNKYL